MEQKGEERRGGSWSVKTFQVQGWGAEAEAGVASVSLVGGAGYEHLAIPVI